MSKSPKTSPNAQQSPRAQRKEQRPGYPYHVGQRIVLRQDTIFPGAEGTIKELNYGPDSQILVELDSRPLPIPVRVSAMNILTHQDD